jgi:hypothetical protein
MHMIGHETVRDNRNALFGCSAQDLHSSRFNAVADGEVLAPPECGERQEISMWSAVIECPEVLRMADEHATVVAMREPDSTKSG